MRSRTVICAAVGSLVLLLCGAAWAQLVPNQAGGSAAGGSAGGGAAGGGAVRGPGAGGMMNPMGGGMMGPMGGGMGGMMGGGMQQTADPKKARQLMNQALALLEKADKQMEDGNLQAARDAYKQAKEKMDTVAKGEQSAAQGGGGAMMGGMMGGGAMAGGGSGAGGMGPGMMPGGGGAGGGGLIANDGAPENMKLRMEARKIHSRALRGLGNAWLGIAMGLMASPETFLEPWAASQGQGTGQSMLPGGGAPGMVGRGGTGGGGGAAAAPAGAM